MKKGSVKLTALVLTAGLTLAENGSILYAAGTDTVLAGLGDVKAAATVETDAAGEEATAVEEVPEEAVYTETDDEAAAADETASEETGAEETAEDAFVPDMDAKGTTGFAICDEYLNVRSSADKESDVVGKVRNFGAMEIVDVDEYGWYKVRSGNVEGYVAGQYVATGSLAEEIASDAGYTYAEIGAEVLNVRSDASTDSDVVATLTSAQEVEVVEDNGDWVKVVVDGNYGYVSSDYVYTTTEYATAETIEEEQQRLDEQWIAYLEQEAAALETPVYDAPAAAYTETWNDSSYDTGYDYSYDTTYADNSYVAQDNSYTVQDNSWAAAEAEAAQAEADLQYQEYLNAQAAADEAAASGDEQAVYEAEAAAQEAYQVFEDAQTAADEAAVTAQEAVEYVETYEDTYAQDYSEESYDTTYTDNTYTEEAYTYTDNGEQANADALYQAYVDAQNAADEAAAGADEQSVYETAAAASEAYEQYVAAQEAADAAAQTAADAQYYGTGENVSYDQTYTDTETGYEESYEDTSYSQEEVSYSSTGSAVANFALQYVGNPYVYGGSSLTGGADCSGFTMAVYENFGISLPHNAEAQSGCGTSVSLDSLQPGDLLFYSDGSGIGHVSIYIGGNQVVHASNPTNGILVSDMSYRTPVSAVRLV